MENNQKNRKHQLAIKIETMNHYGGLYCRCCGETDISRLTIDHIDGKGAEHRKELVGFGSRGCGNVLYYWLKKHNYPSGYQVLCNICNPAKGTFPVLLCPLHHPELYINIPDLPKAFAVLVEPYKPKNTINL